MEDLELLSYNEQLEIDPALYIFVPLKETETK